MNKYKHKIPREDLKRFAKEIAKKLVASDFKAGRVRDPTKIDERQQKKVKEFCKQFFEKAYQKHKKHEMEKAAREKGQGKQPKEEGSLEVGEGDVEVSLEADGDGEDVNMSDDEDADATPSAHTPSERNGTLKRKRFDGDESGAMRDDDGELEPTRSPAKKVILEVETPPPPPPPPAPPIETPPASTPREGERDDEEDVDMDLEADAERTNIYADTSFKGKSMADVLAQAQQEGEGESDDTEGDVRMKTGGGAELDTRTTSGNPMVDAQEESEESNR